MHTDRGECVQIAEATGSRAGSEGLAPGTRCRKTIHGGGQQAGPVPTPLGSTSPAPQPPVEVAPAPHGPVGPHSCPITAVPTVGPQPLQPPELCHYSSPSVFQAFPAAWGAAPRPRARARALVGSTAAAPPKAGSALSKGPSGFPSQARPPGPVSEALRAPVPLSQRLRSVSGLSQFPKQFPPDATSCYPHNNPVREGLAALLSRGN